MPLRLRMPLGRRSLLALLQRTTAREVAARCRVTPMCVSCWASGIARPRTKQRAALQAAYGISPHTWDIESANR